jgi:hypothetical protein
MDPSLQEQLLQVDDPEEELEVLMRLVLPTAVPENVRPVARFGDVITCRIKRKDISEVYGSPLKFSIKASKFFGQEDVISIRSVRSTPLLKNTVPKKTVKDVVIGLVDWGCDFTHPNFRNQDGTTRLIALWDQSNIIHSGVAPYGYGALFTKEEINAALQSKNPFRQLGYHPAKADPKGVGAHGTHVMDIAAGNGTFGSPGMAPQAQLAFVHLSVGDTSGTATLGDSVRILEAIDFLRTVAGDKPLVINMSVGRHGGPHDGNTLVERAIDNFLEERSNTMLCQSTGNYFKSATHASGRVRPGKSSKISFEVDKADITPNEVEVWYSGKDVFDFSLRNEFLHVNVPLNSKTDLVLNEEIVGRVYHRFKDPVNLKNHINIFLYNNAPPGVYDILLSGKIIGDGRFNSWIERDTGCQACQARFVNSNISQQITTGTVCNGFNSLVVGAYDNHKAEFDFGSFSSMGPTADGRYKPDLVAPGVKIRAAKSSLPWQLKSAGELTVMSGTSMAAPQVTGAVARILQVLPPNTPHYVIHNIISASADKVHVERNEEPRIGNGKLNVERAILFAQLYARSMQVAQKE